MKREDVYRAFLKRIFAVKRAFANLPEEWAPLLAGKDEAEIREVVRERLTQVLNEFATDDSLPELDQADLGGGLIVVTTTLDRWAKRELRAWRVSEPLSPSQWAEQHRILQRDQTARPGPWRNANAPYLAGIMDLATHPGVEEITIMKAAQVGVSESIRNVIAYFAEREPDPVLLVLPDENVGRRIMSNRILPLFQEHDGAAGPDDSHRQRRAAELRHPEQRLHAPPRLGRQSIESRRRSGAGRDQR